MVRERVLTGLTRYPEERHGTHVFWQIHNLSPGTREALQAMATEELTQALEGREIVRIIPSEVYDVLRKKHLVRPATKLEEGSVATHLNAPVRAAASLLLAHALPEPGYLADLRHKGAKRDQSEISRVDD